MVRFQVGPPKWGFRQKSRNPHFFYRYPIPTKFGILGSFLSYHFSLRHKFKHETMGEIDAIETEILVLEDIKKEIVNT